MSKQEEDLYSFRVISHNIQINGGITDVIGRVHTASVFVHGESIHDTLNIHFYEGLKPSNWVNYKELDNDIVSHVGQLCLNNDRYQWVVEFLQKNNEIYVKLFRDNPKNIYMHNYDDPNHEISRPRDKP